MFYYFQCCDSVRNTSFSHKNYLLQQAGTTKLCVSNTLTCNCINLHQIIVGCKRLHHPSISMVCLPPLFKCNMALSIISLWLSIMANVFLHDFLIMSSVFLYGSVITTSALIMASVFIHDSLSSGLVYFSMTLYHHG